MVYPLRDISKDNRMKAPEIKAFGLRIFDSQTVPEYLLEFLLIFMSRKYINKQNYASGEFPESPNITEKIERLQYYPIPRVGLKRFIFFDRSKQENRFNIDKLAYEVLLDNLKEKIEILDPCPLKKEDVLNIIQDLFYGFNAVIKNRSWFAQALLPICPEVIFCESIGAKLTRKPFKDVTNYKEVERGFDFTKHDFMARGGEVYFLHIMRGLLEKPELKERLTDGLSKLVSQFSEFSLLANWIHDIWLKFFDCSNEDVIEKRCGWIPDGYSRRAGLSCIELLNLLESKIPPLKKIEILSNGIVFQILRMMCEQASNLSDNSNIPTWIIDIERDNQAIRKRSMESLKEAEEYFMQALYESLENKKDLDIKEKQEKLNKASQQGHKLFRKLSKEIGLIIPPRGGYMRFSLNEDLVKFLVLAIIQPGKKVQLSTFLTKLWEHYGIIIGVDEFIKYSNKKASPEDSVYFDINKSAFQSMLKKCGFLRDLSDATSIVENPFGGDIK